jgi:hypothetical protein
MACLFFYFSADFEIELSKRFYLKSLSNILSIYSL